MDFCDVDKTESGRNFVTNLGQTGPIDMIKTEELKILRIPFKGYLELFRSLRIFKA